MHGWGCTLELCQALGFLSSLRGRACIAAFIREALATRRAAAHCGGLLGWERMRCGCVF